MNLFSNSRHAKRSRGLERAREGEVIGLYTLTEHVRELEKSRGKTTVLDGPGNEGGPGDNRAGRGEREDELGRAGEVEFGIHVDEVVGEEGRERVVEGLDDLGMDGTAEKRGASRKRRLDQCGKGVGGEGGHG